MLNAIAGRNNIEVRFPGGKYGRDQLYLNIGDDDEISTRPPLHKLEYKKNI